MKRRRIIIAFLEGAVVFLAYAVIVILATWPFITHITTHIADHFGDGALHMWNTWWVGQALAGGQSPYFTDRIFYPYGVSLVTQNFAWFHILPSLLLLPFMNDVAAFNTAVLLNLVLCGVVAFWVTRQLSGDARAAFIGGLIYMLWPYRLARLDLPNMLATYWIPLFLLFLIYSIERQQKRYALLAGLFLALTGYARWQFLIPAGIMGLIVALFYLFALPWRETTLRHSATPPLRNLILAGLAAFLLLLPPAALLLSDEASRSNIAYEGDEELLMSADVLAFVTPSQTHALFSDFTEPLQDRYYFDREALRRRPVYIGLIPLLLAAAGVYIYRRRALPWVVMGLVMMLLALGPALRANGVIYETFPTPYGLLSPLHVLELMRNPERFALFIALPMAVLAAYGTAGLLRPLAARPAVSWLITAVLAVLIFLEYFSPQTVLQDRSLQPALYADLAAENGDFALLNLPFDVLKARAYMGDQVVHGKAIVQGNLSRLPPSAGRYIEENPWLAVLAGSGEMAPEFPDISRRLGALAADDIRYLILHKDIVGADRIAHWQRALMVRPRYEDERLIAYSTTPQAGRDFEAAAGWPAGPSPVALSLSAACVHPGHPLVTSIGWGSETAVSQDLDVRLALVNSAGNVGAGLVPALGERFPLAAGWPSSEWPANALAWGHYQLDLPRTLAAGAYDLTAVLVDSATGAVQGTEHALAQIAVEDEICNLAQVEEAVDANVLFGDELRLVEYTAEQKDERLDLTLFWRAERFLDKEYNVFVHVFDPATGVPVAQDDGRPRDGAYAMTHWWPGEVVDDRVTVFLDGAPPGEYGIAIGVYDLAGGERLPIVDAQGELLVEDGRYILPQTVVIP